MKHDRPITAAELLAKLQADPDFQKRMAEKQRKRVVRHARLSEAARPVLDLLLGLGICVNSIEEMVQRFTPFSPQTIQTLLACLPQVQAERIKESLIGGPVAAKEPFDGSPLVDCFLQTKSDGLRWAIANTMAENQGRWG